MQTNIEDPNCLTVIVSKSNKTSVIHGSAQSVEMDKAHQRMMRESLEIKKTI